MNDPRAASGIVHLSLLVTQLVLVAVAVMIERSVMPPEGLSADLLLAVNIVVAVGSIAASQVIGRMLLRAARSLTDESSRMTAGLRAFIVRLALLEAGGVVAIVSYIMTGELTFLGIFAVLFAALLFGKPSEGEWESVQLGASAPDTSV